jgi:protein-arginine kinase activator protein McsA
MDDNASKKDRTESFGSEEEINSDREDLSALGIEELHVLLNEVLEQEDYIRAIAIRDEINKRK